MNTDKQVIGNWLLTPAGAAPTDSAASTPISAVPFTVPGDVHSALLSANLIEPPYYRDNEYAVDWVNKRGWKIESTLHVSQNCLDRHPVLILEGVDCIAKVFVNDQHVGSLDNQFIRYTLPVGQALTCGSNALRIEFDVAINVAAERRQAHPFELPGESLNSRIPNNNFLRKTPCHSGWDWNICLMPTGVYGSVQLQSPERCRIDDVRFVTRFDGNNVRLEVNIQVDVHVACEVPCCVSVGNVSTQIHCELYPGQQRVELELDMQNPARWWPVGMGHQSLHEVTISVDGEQWVRSIGFCETRIVCAPDETGPGRGFAISVNGQDAFMRGANWIPADALPQGGSQAVVRELLQSAIDANMNMLRVWGGGQYEADWFYELCEELGILVWHDFMFSCNHYPATDAHWIASVRTEATQQVRRLSRFACLALWCGDNELVGALKWWEITLDNRDRYLANYVRLNTVLEEVVMSEAPATPWWPSSPSQGLLDYADGWKSDDAGDMHFWDVWHEAKPFSAYQDIQPRFCSEFGFQSFPSMPVVKTFAEPDDQNVSSRVMGVHQRNVGGNARIVETLVRYFPFPESFERTVFLSQCQQAMAIRTGVEYWRSLKPHCMGTLYWQLNDTWPVASWSSLEYGGGWKLLHYAARKFYQNVTMMVVPVDRPQRSSRDFMSVEPEEDAQLCLRAVNDTPNTIALQYTVQAIDMHGVAQANWQGTVSVSAQSASDALSLAGSDIPVNCFLAFQWVSASGSGVQSGMAGDGEYWTRPYKQFDLPSPTVHVKDESDGSGDVITLNTDKPAFFVTVELGGKHVWSDNGFTLLPGKPKTIRVVRELTNSAIPHVPRHVVEHL